MKIEDAIFNWLQIAVVYEARPEDLSAKETLEFFYDILVKDHNINEILYKRDPFKYIVYYQIDGEKENKTFDAVIIDKLVHDIENEPKYN